LSCEISQVRQDATKLFAFARFATATEAHDALEALQPHNLLDCPMKLYISLINSIKYSVISRLWPVLEPQIRKAVDIANAQTGDRSFSVRLSLYNTDETQPIRKFRIYGKDIKALRRVKRTVDTLVKGEIFVHEDGIVWHEQFEIGTGAQFLESLNISTTYAVLKDLRSRTIRFYGEEMSRARIKAAILDYIATLESQQGRIPLAPSELRHLLSGGGIQTLQQKFGEENVRLNIATVPELILRQKDVARAKMLIHGGSLYAPQSLTGGEHPDCTICFCEIENSVELGCGHSSCRNCLIHYIRSSLRSKSVPIICISCTKPVPLSVLRQFPDFDDLLFASFKSYVSSNLTKYDYCPTPDCPQVYRIGTTENVVQCSECLAEICTSCKIEWHEGMSCEDVREEMNPDNNKNKKLMEQLGIRSCPRCETKIEKTYGCNHMTCGGCHTHICWFCMKDFGLNSGSLVYDHMRRAHGSIQ
jgi:hypothetical protein